MGRFADEIAQAIQTTLLQEILKFNVLALGDVYFVVDPADNNYQKIQAVFGDTGRIFDAYDTAYNAATSNNNDIIVLGGQGTHNFSTGIAWTKSRIHTLGMDGGGRAVQQGAKVQNATADTTAYLLKVTGNRNTFRNIKFIQVSTDAAALHVMEMGGEGSLYENCSFIFGVADNLDQTDAYEVVCGEDSGTFRNCTFGSDVLDTSVARTVMVADQVTASQEMKSCQFFDCIFTIASDDAGALFFKVLTTADLKFGQLFVRCSFFNVQNSTFGAVQLTVAVSSIASLVEGSAFFVDCHTNAASFCTTSDQFHISSTASAQGTSGVAVEPN